MQCLVENVPLVDLAWAHQSIIQRKRLPVVGDARYAVTLNQDMSNTCHVSSIKSKSGARYGIGDLVQFTRGSKAISSGRIVDIMFECQGRSCKLEIQLLVSLIHGKSDHVSLASCLNSFRLIQQQDSHGDYDLIDCPSAAKITVHESSLKGNILMLDTDDFHNLGYTQTDQSQRTIFNRSANESQL